jgi:hypothetical protein
VRCQIAIDWSTAASLATAGGTLVLGVATFASVRSANRAGRVAERALQVNQRPLLMPSRLTDATQKIFFQEGRAFALEGGRGIAEVENGVVYLAISLRGVGQGIAMVHGWRFTAGREVPPRRPAEDSFRTQGIDIMVAPGDIGYWEAAFRDSNDSQYDEAVAAVKDGELVNIDLLYGDNEGGQRVMTRMVLRRFEPKRDDGGERSVWVPAAVRHWNVDRPDPRDRSGVSVPTGPA